MCTSVMNMDLLAMCKDCPTMNESVWGGCPMAMLDDIETSRNVVTFEDGAEPFREGMPINAMYCVRTGTFALMKRVADQEPCLVSIITAGDLLGMPDALHESTYNYTAAAYEPASVCLIPKDVYLNLIREHPNVTVAAIRRICHRLNYLQNA